MVTRGTHFNAQRSDNDFVSALREQILWLPAGSQLNPLQWLNPIRPFAQWYYNRRMNSYLSRQIDQCFIAHRQLDHKNESSGHKPHTVIGLALDKYLENQSPSENVGNLDAKFKESAIYQLKGLILRDMEPPVILCASSPIYCLPICQPFSVLEKSMMTC